MEAPILEMRSIVKRFPGVLANDRADLTLYPGEIHALLGENGAGKSTLMNILIGIYYPNEGSILYRGEPVEIASTRTAVDLGIGMVHQHFKLIEPLSVAENVFLGANRCPLLLKTPEMNREIAEFSRGFNLEVNPNARIWQLSIGEQQRVEIIKLLFGGAEILILDEPTAVLTPQESIELFAAMRTLADLGKTIVFITHKMSEVMRSSDRITVLRAGRSVASTRKEDTSIAELTTLMVGREICQRKGKCARSGEETPVLELRTVCAMGDKNLPALRSLDLRVRTGEILGIAGVAGNGQRELAEVITGLRPVTGGKVWLEGAEITNQSPKHCIDAGIAYIPDDRMGTGLVASMDLRENAILRDSDREPCSRRGVLQKTAIQKRTEEFVRAYDIKNAGLHRPVSLMSGGNLQKLLIAREVSGDPRLIVASYPSHGLDVGAVAAIHNTLIEQRNNGAGILFVSEDLDELFEISDRIAVLYEGRIVGILDTGEATYEGIGEMMLGMPGCDPAPEGE